MVPSTPNGRGYLSQVQPCRALGDPVVPFRLFLSYSSSCRPLLRPDYPTIYALIAALTSCPVSRPNRLSLLRVTRLSEHSISNHPAADAGPLSTLRCSGTCISLSSFGFAIKSHAHPATEPNRVRRPTDCSFVSCCSPPRVTATQLHSTTGLATSARLDFHQLVWCTQRRTAGHLRYQLGRRESKRTQESFS